MFASTRSYLTSGAALFGAGAIALTPVQPSLAPGVAPGQLSAHTHAIELSAAINPITRALEVWNNTETNFASLVHHALEAPAPTLQQIIANQLYYMAEVGSIGLGNVIEGMKENATAALHAPFTKDLETLNEPHFNLWQLLPLAVKVPPSLQPILDFTTTYTSGALIGLLGPVLAPVIALSDSLHAITTALFSDSADLQTAITELINIPANMIGAFFNGDRVLDLTPVLSLLNILPSQIGKVAFNLGGLFSPAGSLFNSLDLELDLDPTSPPIHIEGTPSGTIASLVALGGVIAKAIGWSGTGNPLHPGIPVPGPAAVASAAPVAASAVSAAPEFAETAAPVETVGAGDDTTGTTRATRDGGFGDTSDEVAPGPAAASVADARSGAGSKPSKKSSAASSESSASASNDGAGAKQRGVGGSKRAKASDAA